MPRSDRPVEPAMPNRSENRFQTNLMVVLHTLLSDREAAEKRLKEYGYRDVRRDIGLLIHLVNKLQTEMLSTMPDRRIGYYQRMARDAQIIVDFPGPVRTKRSVLVDVEDLAVMCEAAMKSECIMCMRDGREIRRCALHEVLLSLAPPTEVLKVGCEYRGAASQLIQGNDVTI